MWIVKPCGQCQGRGIKVFSSLHKILAYAGIDRSILTNLSLSIQQNTQGEATGS
jgi:hypothetical protein